jgi:hypothetical protein
MQLMPANKNTHHVQRVLYTKSQNLKKARLSLLFISKET